MKRMNAGATCLVVVAMAVAVSLLTGCTTIDLVPPPAGGNIPVLTDESRKVLIVLDGEEFAPDGLFIAIKSLANNGFMPVVEEASIHRLRANLENRIRTGKKNSTIIGTDVKIEDSPSLWYYWIPQVHIRCSDVDHGYASWIREGIVSTNGMYSAYKAPSGAYYFGSMPPTPVVKARDFRSIPRLKITSDHLEKSYAKIEKSYTRIICYPGSMLSGSQRTVQLFSDGKLVWTKKFHITFPSLDLMTTVNPSYGADKDLKSFLDCLSPVTIQSTQ